jgi:signal transduction histidine kinase
VLAYVAELELEVDRLRKHAELLYHDSTSAIRRILELCQALPATCPPEVLTGIVNIGREGLVALRESRVLPGYHPSHDQVVDIAIRPLVQRVFRWRQRIAQMPAAVLHLELQHENLEWFPVRLSHILDNLIANALDYSDSGKGEMRVTVALRQSPGEYELRVSDNGLGMSSSRRSNLLELSHRAGTGKIGRPGVGLAVVRMLVEQSGGSLTIQSSEGAGTSFVALLPRYDCDDFLTDGEQA